jgi:hypothetical protein
MLIKGCALSFFLVIIHLYYMIKPPPSRRQQVLATRVLSKRLLAEMPCSAYTTSKSLYLFSPHSIKCADCVRYNVYCDDNFLADDFDRLTAE